MKTNFLLFITMIFVLISCSSDETPPVIDQVDENAGKEEIIEIKTLHGRMLMWLYEGTPLHKDNFIKLTKEGFYDSTEFHRIVKNFVIQGGDPNSKDDNRADDGQGGPGYTIEQEIDSSKFKHVYGAVGAARNSDKVNPTRASSGSQFYIVTDQNGEHGLDGAYTVFGLIISGMDVAKSLQNEKVNSRSLPITRQPMYLDIVYFSPEQLKDSFNFVP
jgi:cyclophilin family peptidyl-prolyl cis-trans isomerase